MPKKFITVAKRKLLPRLRRKAKTRGKKPPINWATKARPTVLKLRQAFPDRMLVKLTYQDRLVFSGAQSGYVQINGNNIFDPIRTASGNSLGPYNEQPAYRDTYNALYTTYRVQKAKITVSLMNYSTTVPACATLYPSDRTDTPTTVCFQERVVKYCQYRDLLMFPAQARPTILKNWMSTAKINGISTTQANTDSGYQALMTGGPSDQWIWNVHVDSYDGVSFVNVFVDFKVEYFVCLSDPYNDRDND